MCRHCQRAVCEDAPTHPVQRGTVLCASPHSSSQGCPAIAGYLWLTTKGIVCFYKEQTKFLFSVKDFCFLMKEYFLVNINIRNCQYTQYPHFTAIRTKQMSPSAYTGFNYTVLGNDANVVRTSRIREQLLCRENAWVRAPSAFRKLSA